MRRTIQHRGALHRASPNKDAGKAGTIGYYRALVSAYRAAGHHPRLAAELDAVVTQIEDEAGQAGAWPPLEED